MNRSCSTHVPNRQASEAERTGAVLSSRSWHKMRALALNRAVSNVLNWNTKLHGMKITHLKPSSLVKKWSLCLECTWPQLWGNLDDIVKTINCFFLGFLNLETAETQWTQIHWDRSQRKRLSLFSFTLVPTSSWCLARTHIEKFNESSNEGTKLSFFLYNESRYILVWHQRELFNNDVLCTHERLCPRGRWLWCW